MTRPICFWYDCKRVATRLIEFDYFDSNKTYCVYCDEHATKIRGKGGLNWSGKSRIVNVSKILPL